MTVPDFQTLMLPVLQISAHGEVRISNVIEQLASAFSLTAEEKAELLPSGRQTGFANRVHWAKFYLAKASLIEITRRAHFRMTPRGRKVLASPPTRIDIRFLSRFPEFRTFRGGESNSERAATDDTVQATGMTPDEMMRKAHQQLEEELGQELLTRINNAPSDFFERLIVQLLVGMGYGGSVPEAGRALGKSGADGVDGVIDQDALGLDRIYVQAKRYREGNAVGPGAIRDFFGSLDRFKAAKGLFATTSSFSSAARETAELLSKRIVLIDGPQLARLMIRYNIGCRIEETLYIKTVDEEFFE
jgi:restriction system protein